jgi:23S rRNA pseudouridine1911/1915/1917 synthase
MIEDPAENLPYALEVQAPGSQRLDRWLADQRPDLSRSRIQKLIEQGQVRLNGVL